MLKIGSLKASVKIVEKEKFADTLGPETNLPSSKKTNIWRSIRVIAPEVCGRGITIDLP